MMVLGPVIADSSFGRASWGGMITAQTVGLMTGSFFALRWRPQHDLFIGVTLIAFRSLPIFMLSLSASAAWLTVAFFVAGITFGLFEVSWAHSLQTHIAQEKLARIYAYDAVGSFVAIPFGELIAGPLAIHYDSSRILFVSAIIVVLATLGAILVPEIRKLKNPSEIRS